MGILDAINKEDRVEVRYSDFYSLIRGCAERDIMVNGLKHRIPYAHMEAMLGLLGDPEPEKDQQPEDDKED